MNRIFIAMIVVMLGLAGAVSAEDTGSIGCTFTGAILNPGVNLPRTWTVVFDKVRQYGEVITSSLTGVDSLGRGLYGSGHLKGGFPAHLTWTEGPSGTFPDVRHVHVSLEANGQGSGTVVILEEAFDIFSASVVITSTTCGPVTALP